MAIPKNWTSITTSTVTHMNKIESQKNSKHWNAQFHPMKRTIPSYETYSFILWNAPFQCLKLYGCQYLTNHSLISDKRIASKFGMGKFNNVYGISGNNVTAGQKDYAARMMQIEKQREEYYKSLGTPPGVPTMKGATADPDNTGRGYNDIIGDLGDHSVPEGWVQRPKFNKKGDVPGPPVQWQKPEDPDNAQPGYGYIPADTTNIEDIFFYHSDHLGSTSYITDAKANITQFDAYLPYGELLVDEHSSSEEMPYKFNGKELDQETGLYYYGARYMNSVTSSWMSTDPLVEKYPNKCSYVYCKNNPIRYIDPTGMIWEDPKQSESLKTSINNRIESINKNTSKLQSEIETGKGKILFWLYKLNDKQIANRRNKISENGQKIDLLQKSLADIDVLGGDQKHIYALSPISGGEHRVRQGSDGKVYIETSSDAMSIHEITHIRQSLNAGGLKFSTNGELLNSGVGLKSVSGMEIEAYKMQYSYDGTFPGNLGGRGLQGIDVHSVGGIMNDGKPVYPAINQYSIDLNKFSKQQKS